MWVQVLCSSSVTALTIGCTFLAIVAYRIWSINRESIIFSQGSLRPIMLLVIESGAIYSATLTTLLILYKEQSWFQYVILDAVRVSATLLYP